MGQNSTQKPQDLHRSTMISTRPFATTTPTCGSDWGTPKRQKYYAERQSQRGVTAVTDGCEAGYNRKRRPEPGPAALYQVTFA